jgi:ribonuclease inhibitor
MDVELDGRRILTVDQFHFAISHALDFGSYYGANLSALWDRLSRDVPRPVHLTWVYAESSREALGDEVFERIVKILTDVRDSDLAADYEDRFEFEIREHG